MERALVAVEYQIRLATEDDVEAIAALHAESWRTAYRGLVPDAFLDGPLDEQRLQAWRQRFAGPHPERRWAALAVSGPRVLGFTCVLADAEPAHGPLLDNLHVKPDFRGHGIGARLLHESRRWAATIAPGQPMHLWVIEGNSAARRFYRAQGGIEGERRLNDMAGAQVAAVRYSWPGTVAPTI
jgi:GNAT superfamily N-acetyltransferase